MDDKKSEYLKFNKSKIYTITYKPFDKLSKPTQKCDVIVTVNVTVGASV